MASQLRSALVVEDSRFMQKLVVGLLQKKGYEVLCAGTVAEGIDQASRQIFDIALVDLILPDEEGLSVVRHIQKTGASTYIIVMTAHHEVIQDIREDTSVTISGYLPKPFTKSQFDEVVGAVGQDPDGR